MPSAPLLIVITGPTGVGKTEVAVELAQKLSTEIISADSRQIYRDLPVTTGAPTEEQLAKARHHFIGTQPLDFYYSASVFEQEAMRVLHEIFKTRDVAVVCGGSMMYVDALCHGIDDIPTISEEVRSKVLDIYKNEGYGKMLSILQEIDPEYYVKVDRHNEKRVIHAIEICMQSGATYTSLRKGEKVVRPFRILKCMLTAPREVLFSRINRRVMQMADAGMVEEVRKVAHLRHLNSMRTVGVNEMLRYIDGEWSLEQALARMQKNTRVYAKKQLTWYARDPDIVSIDVTQCNAGEQILTSVGNILSED